MTTATQDPQRIVTVWHQRDEYVCPRCWYPVAAQAREKHARVCGA